MSLLPYAPVTISLTWCVASHDDCSKICLGHQHAAFWFAADSSTCSWTARQVLRLMQTPSDLDAVVVVFEFLWIKPNQLMLHASHDNVFQERAMRKWLGGAIRSLQAVQRCLLG
jgi:hypothetical protein